MPYSHRTVVSRRLLIPALDESARADGEAVTTVGVSDLEDGPSHRLSLRREQLEPAKLVLDNRQQGHRPFFTRISTESPRPTLP